MSEATAQAAPFAAPPGGCTPGRTLTVDVSTPGMQVQAGTQVPLSGIAREDIWTVECDHRIIQAPFRWELFFQPPGGNETDITSSLQQASTLNPLFIPHKEGKYRATLTAGSGDLSQTKQIVITAIPAQTVDFQASGRVTAFLVQNIGEGFGPVDDFIDVEVVVQLDSQPNQAFGFQLRNDKNRPAHQGMFDLLRNAFDAGLVVSLSGQIVPGQNNGIITQVFVTKE